MASSQWLDDAEYVRGSAAPILIVSPSELAWGRWTARSERIEQLYGSLIENNDGLTTIERTGEKVENVLHPRDVFLSQFPNAPHFFPATASGHVPEACGGLSRVRVRLQSPSSQLLRKQADRPARVAWRRVCACHGDQRTLLPRVELLVGLGAWIVGECTLESAFEIPPANAPDLARIAADCLAHFPQVSTLVE